jgi:3-hydroxyisobutyrate dehydrogenase-like beta-hydroxyacid dehydrogenase
MKVSAGFIGLGDMGRPMAQNLIAAGFHTTLWARREASLASFAEGSYRRATDPADLGSSSDVVGVCVFADADVREVVLGPRGLLGGLAQGSVILLHSTISTDLAIELERMAAPLGIGVLDAPVSGSGQRAADGQLAIMVGGDGEFFDKALPVMRSYGAAIEHMGPIGSGQKMKALNNALGSANLHMACLAIGIAGKLGLDSEAAIRVLRAASGNSFNLGVLADRLIPNPDFARHAIGMVRKDIGLFRNLCAEANLPESLLDLAGLGSVGDLERLAKHPPGRGNIP